MVKKISLKIIIGFLVFNMFFVPISSILMIRFVPTFKNLRNTLVSSLVVTLSHGYLANLFATQKEIDDIIAENRRGVLSDSSSLDKVKIEHKNDKGIQLLKVSSNGYEGKMLVVNDATRISLALSKYFPSKGQTTSEIASRNHAVAAINGAGFDDKNWSGTGGKPLGFLIKNGHKIYDVDYKDWTSVIGFTKSGELVVGYQSLKQLLKHNIKDALWFGPALVVDGQPMIKSGDGGAGINPRTAIGQTKDGKVLLLAIDGRGAGGSAGASYRDVQRIMLKYGAYTASILDGGSSTTMYYKGRIVNTPCNPFGERSVPAAFIVKP